MKYLVFLLVFLLLFSACNEQQSFQRSEEKKQRGVLSEYVNSPLEQAEDADDISDSRNKAQQRELDQIDQE